MSTITGNTEFNNANNNGTVEGETSFNGDSTNTGNIVGDAYFSDTSTNSGTVEGNAAFYDTASNGGEVTGAAAFLDEAQNNGEIGAACVSAPVITQQPESVYAGPGGQNNAPMLFSLNASNFESASFSVRAEENPWVSVNWTLNVTHGYNNSQAFFVSGKYEEVKDLNISNIGGLPSDIWYSRVNCNLNNPLGEVNTNEVFFKKGNLPTITQEANYGQITVTEGDELVFPFNAFSWADNATVGISNGNMMVDPVVVEGEFNTVFDSDSLNGGRKIVMGQLNLGRPASLEDNNTRWWFRISDVFGSNLAPNEISVYVNPA